MSRGRPTKISNFTQSRESINPKVNSDSSPTKTTHGTNNSSTDTTPSANTSDAHEN